MKTAISFLVAVSAAAVFGGQIEQILRLGCSPRENEVTCVSVSPIDFGAVGDGIADDTQAFQFALNTGSLVKVPAGTFRIGTIFLRSGGGLDMDAKTKLVASGRPEDWCNFQVKDRHYVNPAVLPHLIVATNVVDVVIRGGMIDGSAGAFLTDEYGKSMGGRNIRKRRDWYPHSLLFFDGCLNVRVENLRLRNSLFWNSYAQRCENVTFCGCDVYSDPTVPNNDGLDFLDCRRVRVEDCRVDTGDDAIGIFSNPLLHGTCGAVCEDVVISNCIIRSGYAHGVRIGVGSGEIRNCRVEDVRFDRSRNGIWVCSRYSDRPGRGGQFKGVDIHDLLFRDITGECDQFVFVRHDYKFVLEQSNRFSGEMRNVRFENVRGKTQLPIVVEANGIGEMSGVEFSGCEFQKAGASNKTADDRAFFMIKPEEGILWQTNLAANVSVRKGAVVLDRDFPLQTKVCSGNTLRFDFGRDAFGWLEIKVPENAAGSYEVRLGERILPNGRVDMSPGGTIRAACVTGRLDQAGWFRIPLVADVRNTQGANELTARQLVRLPREQGVVMPFRYAEVVNAPFRVSRDDVRRTWLHWPVDEGASSFSCSNLDLCRVYDFCKYSIVATSFAGLYVDGDRERIPYEADAYINQLGHYAIDPDFGMARKTFRHLLAHPTWPTEWKQHMIMVAWTDWMWSGSLELIRESYNVLRNEKLLLSLAREDGLIVSGGTRHPNPAKGNDIVDWPICERDGFDVRPVNAVVNAFHYLNLIQMSEMAFALGHKADGAVFRDRAQTVKASYNRVFFDPRMSLYVDGEGSSHSSLHVNAAALAFGLVPEGFIGGIADFLERKGMACSVYFAQYLLEALFKANRADAAIRLMASEGDRSWIGMMKQGSTITMEAWNSTVKPNQDWNHAWGTPPLNVMARHVLGVTPLEPGFSRISVNPRIGDLKRVKGIVPTVKGKVIVDVSDEVLSVSVPVPAIVTWRGKVHEVPKGSHVFNPVGALRMPVK